MHLLSALPVQGALYSPLTTSREGKEILEYSHTVIRAVYTMCYHEIYHTICEYYRSQGGGKHFKQYRDESSKPLSDSVSYL